MRRWYVAQTHHDATAVENLKRQGFEHVMLRGRTQAQVVRGVRRDIRLPLLPGYVFVSLDVEAGSWLERDERTGEDRALRWEAVNSTIGVLKLLPRHLLRPLPLPEGVVEELIERAGELDVEDAIGVIRRYVKGETVVFTDGAFTSFPGKVVSQRDALLTVMVEIFGRASQVTTRVEHVRVAG